MPRRKTTREKLLAANTARRRYLATRQPLRVGVDPPDDIRDGWLYGLDVRTEDDLPVLGLRLVYPDGHELAYSRPVPQKTSDNEWLH